MLLLLLSLFFLMMMEEKENDDEVDDDSDDADDGHRNDDSAEVMMLLCFCCCCRWRHSLWLCRFCSWRWLWRRWWWWQQLRRALPTKNAGHNTCKMFWAFYKFALQIRQRMCKSLATTACLKWMWNCFCGKKYGNCL